MRFEEWGQGFRPAAALPGGAHRLPHQAPRATPPLACIALALLAASCAKPKAPTLTPAEFAAAKWETIAAQARGAEVALAMWSGDEDRNRFFRSTVTRRLHDDLGIALRIVPLGDTVEAVNKLLNEKSAGK